MRLLTPLGGLPLSSLLLLVPLVTAQLGIEVTKAVECTRKTENGDTIQVHYRGTLQSDGSEFDSSFGRGPPFEFTLGAGQVIQGWDQGLLGMCIGEGRKLTIPPSLAYGSSQVGTIPAGSTLIFETELMGIQGVKKEDNPPPPPPRPTIARPPSGDAPVTSDTPTPTPTPTPSLIPTSAVAIALTSAIAGAATPSPTSEKASPLEAEENGECHLLGSYALMVQGFLGLLAVSSLVYKRWRETPRRPLKIWFFDVSKQVFGSVLLHLANILMSMLSSGKFDVAAKTQATPQYAGQDDEGKQPNPCSFYLLNLAIDTTIGIPILVLLLKILHRVFLLTPLASPPESIRSGNYGQPPRATWWLKQSIIYFLGLFGMKLCVFLIFQLLPWIAWVGDWALRWTEGNEAIQITFVMFVFPLIMNALQYWIIDGFIKDKGNTDGSRAEGRYQGVGSVDEDEDEDDESWLERHRRSRVRDQDEDSEIEDLTETEGGPLKEANPTPVPVRRGSAGKMGKARELYDPAPGSSGSEGSGGRDLERGR
ncbi:Vaculolar membrane protein-domain-containing protein [Clohesyomyces aquaticus]|uniref:peptidylprolyl isomerase n=1 Tax=Clohesyomyces aquaticus TaxID=1231657 RepID=A0A1Y1ZNQ2_9PLEO|nr:Vaculolar membrane protein-domain-containing protein [Clohesyomyces aquaticus]